MHIFPCISMKFAPFKPCTVPKHVRVELLHREIPVKNLKFPCKGLQCSETQPNIILYFSTNNNLNLIISRTLINGEFYLRHGLSLLDTILSTYHSAQISVLVRFALQSFQVIYAIGWILSKW